jgi:hypothetical protein
MNGRSTTCITIRLDDIVVKALEDRAKKCGLDTAGAYIKQQILKGLNSAITTNTPIDSEITKEPEHYQLVKVNGKIEKQEVDADGYRIMEA